MYFSHMQPQYELPCRFSRFLVASNILLALGVAHHEERTRPKPWAERKAALKLEVAIHNALEMYSGGCNLHPRSNARDLYMDAMSWTRLKINIALSSSPHHNTESSSVRTLRPPHEASTNALPGSPGRRAPVFLLNIYVLYSVWVVANGTLSRRFVH